MDGYRYLASARSKAGRRRANGVVALSMALMLLGACSKSAPLVETLPRPSAGVARVVPGQPPVVWVSGQSVNISPTRLVVVGRGGSRTVIHRLSRGATKFFVLHRGQYEGMPEADALLVEAGTAMCVESLLDGRSLLALRVFLGAACGPRT